MDEKTLRKYWRFFSEVWQLFKKYSCVDSDQEWDRLVVEATMLRNRYPGEFSRKILMETLDEIERVNK